MRPRRGAISKRSRVSQGTWLLNSASHSPILIIIQEKVRPSVQHRIHRVFISFSSALLCRVAPRRIFGPVGDREIPASGTLFP